MEIRINDFVTIAFDENVARIRRKHTFLGDLCEFVIVLNHDEQEKLADAIRADKQDRSIR